MKGLKAGEIYIVEKNKAFAVEIHSARHQWTADEPKDVPGGEDQGPDPYDLLLASLGSCTVMTLRMYIQRKGWPVDEIRIKLWHSRSHVKDCQDCEAEGGAPGARLQNLHREIYIKGGLTDQQISRLKDIADRCPVHKTLTGPLQTPLEMVVT